MRRRLATLTSLVLLAPLSASAAGPTRPAVELLLSGYEHVPTPGELAGLGPECDRRLIELAADSAARPLVRLRAISALALVPSAAGRAFLVEAIRTRRAEPDLAGGELLLLGKAARALATLAGAKALTDVAPLLDHPSRDVRQEAVLALSAVASPRAAALLRARLGREPEPALRRLIERRLSPGAPAR